MYPMHTNARTGYGLHHYGSSSGSNSSSEQQHPSHPTVHPRSIEYLNFAPGTPLFPEYLNFAPEHKHLQRSRAPTISPSHSTYSPGVPAVNTQYPAVPNLIQVPQKSYRNQSLHSREPSVSFRMKGSSELGVQIFDVSHVEGKRETPLSKLVYRIMNVRINWPGYEPSFGRIKICEGEPITRIALLYELARIIRDFLKSPGPCRNQDWNLGRIDPDKLVVTRLVHCGGADWQPELWYPGH